MNADRTDCGDCEAEALARVQAVRDLLEMVLWAETDPVRAVERAIQGLCIARNQLYAASGEGAL